jgi:hypothetical protein
MGELKRETLLAEPPEWLVAGQAGQARQEAARLIDELPPEQVHARINREQGAARSAAVHRAGQLARRAFGEGLNG